jgi:hypothetical protein
LNARPPTAAPIRGIIVVVVAVALGAVLLSQSERVIGSPEEGSAAPETSTTTTTRVTDLTASSVTTGPTVGGQAANAPGEVSVIVLNGSGQSGVATSNANAVAAAGFSSLEAKNALPTDTTTVYYAPGFEADAAAVKLVLRLATAPVQPAPAEPIVPEAAEADVVVVLGTDYEASGGGTATTEG